MKNVIALITGLLLSIGLGFSGMTQPEKVYNFFNMFGKWDPAMMFVIVSAIGVHMVLYHLIRRREAPVYAEKFMVPGQGKVDARLLIGAILFGMGWAITGFCPAPAFTALVSGHSSIFIFLGSAIAGILTIKLLKI